MFVIDSGRFKKLEFDSKTRCYRLDTGMISRASADQRKGRVGRNRDGFCYRLFRYENLSEYSAPEVQSTDLAEIYMQLRKMGKDLETFPFLDKPCERKIADAKQLLMDLEIIDSNGEFTCEGEAISMLPVHPQLARALYNSVKFNCTEEMTIIAATICSEVSIMEIDISENNNNSNKCTASTKYEKFVSEYGDHMTLLNIYKEWNKSKNKKKWCDKNYLSNKKLELIQEKYKMIKKSMDVNNLRNLNSNTTAHPVEVLKCLLSGYFNNVCFYIDGSRFRLSRLSGYYLYNTNQRLLVGRGNKVYF